MVDSLVGSLSTIFSYACSLPSNNVSVRGHSFFTIAFVSPVISMDYFNELSNTDVSDVYYSRVAPTTVLLSSPTRSGGYLDIREKWCDLAVSFL